MKVTVSVRGKFHAFELASQLQRRGYLERLITSYPASSLHEYGVPRDRVTALPVHEVASRLWGCFPQAVRERANPQPFFHNAFDWQAARSIPAGTDLYVGWSGFSERGIQRARGLGAVTLVERGSAHIEVQRDLLREEYERWCLSPALPDPAVVNKEVREYALADYICVPSTFARRSFLEKGIAAHKLITIPLGVNAERFRPGARDDDVFRVVYAGAMTLRKGVPYLLQAFAELDLPGAELWLVGSRSSELATAFQRYEGQFRHFDSVPEARLPGFYAQCSVFALCSIEDGFAMVLTQAMASGLPVIATTNSGGPDVVRDGVNGFIVPIRDVEALKARLLQLYEDREQCRAMGEEASRSAAAGLTWDRYGEAIATAYGSIVSGSRPPEKGIAASPSAGETVS